MYMDVFQLSLTKFEKNFFWPWSAKENDRKFEDVHKKLEFQSYWKNVIYVLFCLFSNILTPTHYLHISMTVWNR